MPLARQISRSAEPCHADDTSLALGWAGPEPRIPQLTICSRNSVSCQARSTHVLVQSRLLPSSAKSASAWSGLVQQQHSPAMTHRSF
jgi:hypothetical protein